MSDKPHRQIPKHKPPGPSPWIKYAFYGILATSLTTGFGSVIAQKVGREDLSKNLFGPLFAIFTGTFFAGAVIVNAVSGEKVWVKFFGWIKLTDHPIPYLAVLSIPLLMGLAAIFVGIWALFFANGQ